MARVCGIMGESGSGKTTAMRTLDPETTYYIDCDKKGLSWKGWKDSYKAGVNYLRSNAYETVFYTLATLNLDDRQRELLAKKPPLSEEKRQELLRFKTIVVDTLNGIMVGHEMRHIREKDWDKWTDLAANAWNLIEYALTMRDDLTIIFIFHSETYRDDLGNTFTRIKTNGRKLEKIVLESKLPTLFLATGMDGDYKFLTKASNCTCKAPMGAFESDSVPNDMKTILEALEGF